MRLAIEASRKAVEAGNTPFGATLVSAGKLLHVSGNTQVTTGDCTNHAEIALVREAGMVHGREVFENSTVYASGEPCAMCSAALFWAGVARIVFAATTDDINRAMGEPYLSMRSSEVIASSSRPIQIDGPLLRSSTGSRLARADERRGCRPLSAERAFAAVRGDDVGESARCRESNRLV
jgi:tRNA(Arg) A34 adenosine deaminase TadA